jgi:3',5'-cyclic AMP phosphodiesterase CpdA
VAPASRINRREFLSALPPAAAALIAAPALAAGVHTVFRFFEINDLHYVSTDCGRWFRAVVEQMKTSAPDAAFCLLCGDIADKGDEPSLAGARDVFGGLGIPLHPVPGNHDFTEEQSRAGYDAVFPGKLNYQFERDGWQFIGLDTTMGTKYENTTIAEETLAFLDDPKLDARKPTVAFTHFPLAPNVAMTPRNAPALVERLTRLNLVAALSGHWHGASERVAGRATLVTSRCSARVRNNADRSPRKGWYVCEARADGSLRRRFVDFNAPADIPTDDVAGKKRPAK